MEERGLPEEPAGGIRASASLLRRNRDFRRLYLASLVSFGGDWFLLVALFLLVLVLTGSAVDVALVLTVQEFTYFVASPLAGYLVDRLDRRKLMIVSDAIRALLCVGFLLVRTPGQVIAVFLILIAMSVLSAAFEPASQAVLPNVVDPPDLATANALTGSLWGTMLVVGAGLGGIVTAAFGRDASILIDATSFGASALLIGTIRRPFSRPRESAEYDRFIRGTLEGWLLARDDRNVFALLAAKVGWGLSGGVLVLLPLFARDSYRTGAAGLGLLMAARGLGALVGPFVGRSWLGPGDRRLFVEIGVALAVFGLGYGALSVVPGMLLAVPALFVASIGGGTFWTLTSYGLQAVVPDAFRGRVFALDAMLETLTFGSSGLFAAWLADSVGLRAAAACLGAVAIVWMLCWFIATANLRRRVATDGLPRPD